MRKLFVLICFLSGHIGSWASIDVNMLWQKGNTCYQQKQFDSATFFYEQIAILKPANADIYYNLGNAYYRANRVAPAILNYERALRINPDHKLVKDNLILAQSRITNSIHSAGDIFFMNWWQSTTRPDRANTWAITALILFTLIIVVQFIRKTISGRQLPVQVPGVLSFVFICILLLAIASANNMNSHNKAVVMQNDAPLMNIEQKGKPLALIPEGTTVKITGEKAGWIEVSLPDGRSGWLAQNVIDKI